MSVSFVAQGSLGSSTSTGIAPGYPTGIAAGDLLVAAIASSNRDGIDVPQITAAGWTLLASYSGGDPAAPSAAAGLRRITLWTKVADGAETGTASGTQAGTITGRVAYYRMAAYRKTLGNPWVVRTVNGQDATVDTSANVAASSALAAGVDDRLSVYLASVAMGTVSSVSLVATGGTLGTVTARHSGGTTSGDDAYLGYWDAAVLTATGSVTPSWTATTTTAAGQAGIFVLMSDASALSDHTTSGSAVATATATANVAPTAVTSGSAVANADISATTTQTVATSGTANATASATASTSQASPTAGTASATATATAALATEAVTSGTAAATATATATSSHTEDSEDHTTTGAARATATATGATAYTRATTGRATATAGASSTVTTTRTITARASVLAGVTATHATAKATTGTGAATATARGTSAYTKAAGGTGAALATASATVVHGVTPEPTPDSRRLTVLAEIRRAMILRDDRTATIAAEVRRHPVTAELRAHPVPAESRREEIR